MTSKGSAAVEGIAWIANPFPRHQDRTRESFTPLTLQWRPVDRGWPDAFEAKRNVAEVARRIAVEAAVEGRGKDRLLSYSRRKSGYATRRYYCEKAINCGNVVAAVSLLKEEGLIENHIAQAHPSGGYRSYLCATERLLAIPLPEVEHVVPELVVLKKGDTRVDYKDTAQTDRLRKRLRKINEINHTARIDIVVPGMKRKCGVISIGSYNIYPKLKTLYCVFNEDWKHGGRMYGGWWQDVKKDHRKAITIDGQPTVEHDFSQLHPTLLYAMAGEELSDDAYIVQGFERFEGKKAFNIALNAKSWRSALLAVCEKLGCDQQKAKALLRAVQAKHQNIKSYFYTGIGRRLQNIDAEMALNITSHFSKMKIPCLPVHDSFIVPVSFGDSLSSLMNEQLSNTTRSLSMSCTL